MHPFLKACGATGPLQFSVERQGVPRAETVSFDQPFLLIGRDPNSDLHFPHADVSERHVYLQVVGGHLCYVDLGSRAGTHLEGRSLRSGWLPPHKTLRIGPYRVRLLGGTAEEPGPVPAGGAPGFGLPPLRDASPASLTLELLHRGIRSSLCPVHGDLTLVGSSTDCDVRVLDPSVSNYHASLLHTPEGVWVVDLLGMRGVTLNGDAVRFARVEDGGELRVGHSLVRLRCGVRPAAAGELVPTEAPADLVPARAEAAAPPALVPGPLPAAVAESFLNPLVDQFRVMQQELFEQLRHEFSEELSRAGAELLQQLSAAHQEHARSLKEEFDALRAELVAQVAMSQACGGPTLAPSAPPTRLGTAVAAPASRPFALSTLARSDNGDGDDRTSEDATDPQGDRADNGLCDEPETVPGNVEDAHAWLYQRISMIQDERQNRWQKLRGMIPVELLGRLSV